MQKYPFIPARNFSFICSKILYKDFLMKPRVRRFFSKIFEDFLQNTYNAGICMKQMKNPNKWIFLH